MGAKTGRPTPLEKALDVATQVQYELTKNTMISAVLIAGSCRRKYPTVHDVDLVVVSRLVSLEVLGDLLGLRWTPKGGYGDIDDVRVELTLSTPECAGATMLYRTGPADLNVYMRRRAQRYGWKLSERGLLTQQSEERVDNPTGDWRWDECQLFELLNLPDIEASDRSHWRDLVRGH